MNLLKKYKLKNIATSKIKIQQVLQSLSLNDVVIYLRDGPFESNIGIVTLNSSKSSHWVCYIDENYFDSYGVVCSKKQSSFIMKRNRYCLYSDNQIQKNDSFCASYCLYLIHLVKVLGIDFKSAVFNLFHQRFFQK